MPDEMDRVQQHAQDLAADALARHKRSQPRGPGRQFCEDESCGEPIAPARQALGAVLCLECQAATEARSAHVNVGRR